MPTTLARPGLRLLPGEISIQGIHNHPDLARFAGKRAAAAHIRQLGLGADVQPVRARSYWGACWVVWVVPVCGPGEGRILATRSGGWLVQCTTGCTNPAPGSRHCPGHPTTAELAAN